jgi:hypothetical protein
VKRSAQKNLRPVAETTQNSEALTPRPLENCWKLKSVNVCFPMDSDFLGFNEWVFNRDLNAQYGDMMGI